MKNFIFFDLYKILCSLLIINLLLAPLIILLTYVTAIPPLFFNFMVCALFCIIICDITWPLFAKDEKRTESLRIWFNSRIKQPLMIFLPVTKTEYEKAELAKLNNQ